MFLASAAEAISLDAIPNRLQEKRALLFILPPDKLLALDAPPLVPQEDAPEKAAPSLRVLDAEVQVHNSYAIKEQVCLA